MTYKTNVDYQQFHLNSEDAEMSRFIPSIRQAKKSAYILGGCKKSCRQQIQIMFFCIEKKLLYNILWVKIKTTQ